MRLHFTLLFLLYCFVAQAQKISPENRIVVLGQASINVPADQVKFSVLLEATDSASIDYVYQKHREQEQKLVSLLQDLAIPAKDISYSLFSVQRRHSYYEREAVPYFSGWQTVTFKLSNVENLSEVQARLIREGFTGFSSEFASTKLDRHRNEALERAVAAAREKAAVLASAADRKIKRIVKVADTEDTDPVFNNYQAQIVNEMELADAAPQSNGLINIPQTIPVSATVKVVFELR